MAKPKTTTQKLLALSAPKTFNSKMAGMLILPLVIIGVGIVVYSRAATVYPIVFGKSTYDPKTFISSTGISTIMPTATTPASIVALTANTFNSNPRYSPDHKYIVWNNTVNGTAGGKVTFYNVATKASTQVAIPGNGYPSNIPPVWLPDSKSVIVAANNGTDPNTYLYKVSAVGAATQVIYSSIDVNNLTSLAVNGNGSFAYAINGASASGPGVYTFTPTYSPLTVTTPTPGAPVAAGSPVAGARPVRVNSLDCRNVRTRPGTTADFGYLCYSAGKNIVFRQTVGGTATAIYTSSAITNTVGTSYSTVSAFDWSPDGQKIALAHNTLKNTANCTVSDTPLMGTISYSGTGYKTLATIPARTHTSCAGGGSVDSNSIRWSGDGSSIIFMASINCKATTGLYPTCDSVVQKSSATTANSNKVLLGANQLVADIDW